jgi:hypothetical protein
VDQPVLEIDLPRMQLQYCFRARPCSKRPKHVRLNKGAITGTLRSCDPQHAPRYLAAFEWRHNRRFELPKISSSLPAPQLRSCPNCANRSPKSAERSGSGAARLAAIPVGESPISVRVQSTL